MSIQLWGLEPAVVVGIPLLLLLVFAILREWRAAAAIKERLVVQLLIKSTVMLVAAARQSRAVATAIPSTPVAAATREI